MNILSRRSVLAGAAALAAGLDSGRAKAQPAETDFSRDRLVLLGTKGGPSVWNNVQTPSCSLIIFEGVPYLIDTGYGVTFRLLQARFHLAHLRHIFITHLHSDHSLELGPLLYNAWVNGLQDEVNAYGPEGIENLVSSFWQANSFDIDTRIADEGRPDPRRLVSTHAVDDGVILAEGNAKVSALRNLHPPITDSFAYKFELGGKTVVFSGDTAYFPPLAEFAKGADILVHEVMYGPAIEAREKLNPNAPAIVSHLMAAHTIAEDVGRIAAQAGVKTLVLNHFVPPMNEQLTPDVWAKAAATTFGGNIVVGHDLMEIPLS